MYITVQEARHEAGDPAEEDVSDQKIEKAIAAAETVINNRTGQTWTELDFSWPLVQEITRLLSAFFIMKPFDDPKGEAESNKNDALMFLDLLMTEDQGSGDINVTSPDYKTWPLNPNAKIGRGRLFTSKIGNSVNPEDIYDDLYDQA